VSRYAENTQVGSDRSRAEIERTLVRYGASGFMYGWDENVAVIAFKIKNRQVRFNLPLPLREDFTYTETGRSRTSASAETAYERAVKQRWRALSLIIKAKLEAVEGGITGGFDDEFLAHLVLPGGQTVGERMRDDLATTLESGNVPALLPRMGGAQ